MKMNNLFEKTSQFLSGMLKKWFHKQQNFQVKLVITTMSVESQILCAHLENVLAILLMVSKTAMACMMEDFVQNLLVSNLFKMVLNITFKVYLL